MGTPQKISEAMLQIKNAGTGYSQGSDRETGRWSFVVDKNTRPLVLRANRNADCSSAVGASVVMGGYNLSLETLFWTGNLPLKLASIGFQELLFDYDAVKVGDVLWRVGHTEVVTSVNPKLMTGARHDENGGLSGKPGNQTGTEFATSPLSSNWSRIFRAPNINGSDNKNHSFISEMVDFMKATHIIFQVKNNLYMASILSGTYTRIVDPQALKDQQAVIRIAGGKVTTWQALTGGKNNYASPHAFGKEVK